MPMDPRRRRSARAGVRPCPAPACRRLVVRSGTRVFMFWMVVWSLFRLGLLGSFTSLVLGLGGAIWVVGGGVGGVFLGGVLAGALLRVRLVAVGVGCTAAGAWRAGGLMGCWSLWVARTSRGRYAGFGLSLGRSGRCCLGGAVYRRRRWLRGRRAGGSLLAMW